MTAIDPVCRMKVEEKGAKYTSVHEGKSYYFCNQACKRTFDSDPKRYAS